MPPVYVKFENALKVGYCSTLYAYISAQRNSSPSELPSPSSRLSSLCGRSSSRASFRRQLKSQSKPSKRFKHTDVKILEPIVLKFIDLCVANSRKSHVRLALLTYKNAVQGTAVQSIETVLNHLIAAAESKLAVAIEEAKKEVAALPENPVIDDELPLQPTDMLFDSFVDKAGDRERIERRMIAPAQKFCWDAYDISLDVAKGNDRLELIYQSIAHRAFEFCKVHQRKSDFRRLCEQRLRKDITNAAKYGHQQHAVNLQDPETLARHLDTRFVQLETAVQLELWQEAFRSVEDVHQLIQGKRSRPAMMANYYEKLTQIFKAEGGKQTGVFHAAAWAHYFHHAERAGLVTPKAAGCVLLSALAVPLSEVEAKQRLVTLLNLEAMPTRDELVKDAAARHLRRVPAEIRQIYDVVEVNFHPLTAAKRLTAAITNLAPEYQPYLPALKEVVFSRILRELSQLYDTISLDSVLKLIAPFKGTSWETDVAALEKLLITFSRETNIPLRVDHVAKSITFNGDTTDLHRLSSLAICLYNTINYLNPVATDSRAVAFAKAIKQAEEERAAVAYRRQIVTKRRELQEEASLRREREESSARAERAKIAAEEAARREKEATKAAELERLQKQMEATRREEAQKMAETLAAKGDLKVDVSKIEDLDTTKLVELQVEQLAKEKREMNERLRIVAKRVDHLERAFRKEERPLLAQDYERQKVEDREAHEKANAIARQQAIEQQKALVELSQRLGRMLPDYQAIRDSVEAKQAKELQEARETAKAKIAEEKAKFRASLVARKKAEKERREQERAAAEEEERREAERAAEAARLAEEREAEEARAKAEIEAREAQAAERAAKLRAEREAERAKLDEIARKQREREEEAERRRAERASGAGSARPTPSATPSSGAGAGGPPRIAGLKPGGWRERAAAAAAGGAPGGATPPPAAQSPEPSAQPERGGVWRRGMARGRGGASSSPSTRGGSPW